MSDVVVEQSVEVIEISSEQIEVISIGTPGPPGPPGPQGADGGATSGVYVHTHDVASSSWTINHNLGYFPSVTTVNQNKQEVLGDLTYVNNNTVQINFSVPVSGFAYFS